MAYKRAVVAAAVEVADGQPGWAHTAKALADQYGRDYGKVCDDVWSATIAIQELPEGVELIAPPVRRPR